MDEDKPTVEDGPRDRERSPSGERAISRVLDELAAIQRKAEDDSQAFISQGFGFGAWILQIRFGGRIFQFWFRAGFFNFGFGPELSNFSILVSGRNFRILIFPTLTSRLEAFPWGL